MMDQKASAKRHVTSEYPVTQAQKLIENLRRCKDGADQYLMYLQERKFYREMMEQKANVNRHGVRGDLPSEYPVTRAQKLIKDFKKLRKTGQSNHQAFADFSRLVVFIHSWKSCVESIPS